MWMNVFFSGTNATTTELFSWNRVLKMVGLNLAYHDHHLIILIIIITTRLVWIQLITIITWSYSSSSSPPLGWFECNCTYQEPSGIAIWEPCNYASNLAYDRFPNLHFQNNNICLWARLMVEVCLQQGWAFPQETVEDWRSHWHQHYHRNLHHHRHHHPHHHLKVAKIAEAFAIVTAASSFFHGSQTQLGGDMDRKSNDLFVFIVYQAQFWCFRFGKSRLLTLVY